MVTTAAPAKAGKKGKAAKALAKAAELVGRTKIQKLTAEQSAAVSELKQLRATRNDADKRIKELEGLVKPIGADGTVIIGTNPEGVPVVQFGDGTWNGTDEKLLEEAFPEAFAATRIARPYVTVKPL